MAWLSNFTTITNGGMLFIVVGYMFIGSAVTYFFMSHARDEHGYYEYRRGVDDGRMMDR